MALNTPASILARDGEDFSCCTYGRAMTPNDNERQSKFVTYFLHRLELSMGPWRRIVGLIHEAKRGGIV
jgi:hypothetical protein